MIKQLFSIVVASGLLVASACNKSSTETPVSTTCAADTDCVFFCEARKSCCVNPCSGSCKQAVHRDEKAAIEKFNRDNCTEADRKQCPVAGACAPEVPNAPKATPRCHAGACVVELTPVSAPTKSN